METTIASQGSRFAPSLEKITGNRAASDPHEAEPQS